MSDLSSADLDRQLAAIPVEYQEIFRQTLEQEVADNGGTDNDILDYLRQRQDDFLQGAFIRPDGRTGAVVLDPELLYDQALPELVRDTLGGGARRGAQRRTLLKAGAVLVLALLLLVLAVRARSGRRRAAATPTAVAAVAPTAQATESLPQLSGVEETLQTIGGLGGALTIGRPSSLELHYAADGETLALAIDPSRTTTRGELRYSEATMRSERPVAVWLFGTVINYAIGVPAGVVANLQPDDRVVLNSDTGAALQFVVVDRGSVAAHETDILSQNRPGVTLFALPAAGDDDVAFAFARYDIGSELESGPTRFALGAQIALDGDATVTISETHFTHDGRGALLARVSGTTTSRRPLLLSLLTPDEQTGVVPIGGAERWQAEFSLADSAEGQPLLAELRTASNQPIQIDLGDAPRLADSVRTQVVATHDVVRAAVTITVTVHGAAGGVVTLPADFVQLTLEGGDVYDLTRQLGATLPHALQPGETLTLTLASLPYTQTMRLQLGADLWQIADRRP